MKTATSIITCVLLSLWAQGARPLALVIMAACVAGVIACTEWAKWREWRRRRSLIFPANKRRLVG